MMSKVLESTSRLSQIASSTQFGKSKSTIEHNFSKLRSNYSLARSKFGSTLEGLILLNREKQELTKELPALIRSLKFFLSLINFFLFCVHVVLFGFCLASVITGLLKHH